MENENIWFSNKFEFCWTIDLLKKISFWKNEEEFKNIWFSSKFEFC